MYIKKCVGLTLAGTRCMDDNFEHAMWYAEARKPAFHVSNMFRQVAEANKCPRDRTRTCLQDGDKDINQGCWERWVQEVVL